jgi:hypothetical protein
MAKKGKGSVESKEEKKQGSGVTPGPGAGAGAEPKTSKMATLTKSTSVEAPLPMAPTILENEFYRFKSDFLSNSEMLEVFAQIAIKNRDVYALKLLSGLQPITQLISNYPKTICNLLLKGSILTTVTKKNKEVIKFFEEQRITFQIKEGRIYFTEKRVGADSKTEHFSVSTFHGGENIVKALAMKPYREALGSLSKALISTTDNIAFLHQAVTSF